MHRRRFMVKLGGCAAVALSGPTRPDLAVRAQEAALRGGGLHRFSRLERALGSRVELTVFHESQDVAAAALTAAFAELDRVESVLSLYRPTSQLCQLNREKTLNQPDRRLLCVLRQAAEISALSAGAFDITVQPLWQLYQSAQKTGGLPDEEQVRETLQAVNWRHIDLHDDQIRLTDARTTITLNGIAQGYAADQLARTLRQHDIEHALVDAGELQAVGLRPSDDRWRVGIQHPRDEDAFATLISLADRSLATSGDYESSFTSDFQHHHILDPRTGSSPRQLASVAVLARSAMLADALSTTLMVLGTERGQLLLEHFPDADAWFMDKQGRMQATAGFPLLVS